MNIWSSNVTNSAFVSKSKDKQRQAATVPESDEDNEVDNSTRKSETAVDDDDEEDQDVQVQVQVQVTTTTSDKRPRQPHSDHDKEGELTFESFRLSHLIYERIKNQIGLVKPTRVQSSCIPPLLRGLSCIAHAPTGTGKTLAFGIPMIQKWGQDPYGVFALILTPTRELALQIKDQLQFLGGERAKVSLIIGGVDFQQQAIELFSKPSFVVATPGRLLDHLESDESSFHSAFRNCRYLVYDEADKLLDGQFDENLDGICSALPKKKQVMFFSATMTASEEMIEALGKLSQSQEPPFIYSYQEEDEEERKTKSKSSKTGPDLNVETPGDGDTDCDKVEPLLSKIPLTQKFILCPKDFKDGYLMELLRSIRDNEIKLPVKVRSMIIFAATIRETQVLSLLLSNLGFENATLHSHIDQKSRAKALSDFRSTRVNTLVATDVVSRGLDIRTVDLVINYSIPMPPDYVHRVGRTGRAGQPGLAIMFVVPTRDIPFLNNVEEYIGEKLTEMKIDERKVLKILTDVQANRKIADLTITENDPFEERAKINQKKKQIEAELDELEGKPKKVNKKRKFVHNSNSSPSTQTTITSNTSNKNLYKKL